MQAEVDSGRGDLVLRPASTVMDIERLGTLYPYPLSFMRSLVRRISREGWAIERSVTELNATGHGHAIYSIDAPRGRFSYVVFAKHLPPVNRSDRVIAEDWNLTVTLCEGDVDAARLEDLRANVPLQEKGRVDARCLVLSRANKSQRNFDAVVDRLAEGRQPDMEVMAKVGYLYRTTAVYGSGKFGMADWKKVRTHYPDFARPFAAEMFSCFLIRDFSLIQADHVAKAKAPETAVTLNDDIKRYIGIGNATGLGMAPYLINHPQLIDNWITVRETALARVKRDGVVSEGALRRFAALAAKAVRHLEEIATDNEGQNAINARAREDVAELAAWVAAQDALESWVDVTQHAEAAYGPGAQELLHAVLLEMFPELIVDLEDSLNIEEAYDLVPEMELSELRWLIESKYGWALDVDFENDASLATFWYRSEEKQEPRLGMRGMEPGERRQMLLGVARMVRECFDDMMTLDHEMSVARFALGFPKHRYIIRRMQTMTKSRYGEIRANVLDADVLPIHLLRCKLSFFGVGKFDPRSKMWVRNTMFQGAPLVADIGPDTADDWCFPVKPRVSA